MVRGRAHPKVQGKLGARAAYQAFGILDEDLCPVRCYTRLMNRREHFDAGHGSEGYTVKRHPAFDWDHELSATPYGESVRNLVAAGNSLEQADAVAIVDHANKNPFDDRGDAREQARYHAYEGYLDNEYESAIQNPGWILGMDEHRFSHPQSTEDLEKRLNDLHSGAMSHVDSYEDEYGRHED